MIISDRMFRFLASVLLTVSDGEIKKEDVAACADD